MRVFWLVLLGLLWWTPTEATTITAASCSNANVNTAISSAVDGDTVIIPAGTCTWTAMITFTGKSITLKGVGAGTEAQCAVGGQTTYTCLNRTAPLLDWTTKATGNTPAGFSELTAMTITVNDPTTGCSVNGAAGVNIRGHSQNVRIHHTVMAHYNCGSILMPENTNGVIDHNAFIAHNGGAHALVLGHRSWLGVGNYGDNSWATNDTIGGVSNIFVEDNTFDIVGVTSTAYTDNGYGGRIVERFNTGGNGSFQTHGTESGGRGWRGPRHMEVYRNTHVLTTTQGSVESMRGVGTFRVFDNVVTGTTPTNVVDFNVYRVYPGEGVPFYPWAFCGRIAATLTRSGTTATVTTAIPHGVSTGGGFRAYMDIVGAGAPFDGVGLQVNGIDTTHYSYTVVASGATTSSGISQASYDGNTDSTGYPCLDQVGRGKGILLSGDPFAGQTPVSSLAQALAPAYIWNNTKGGVLDDAQSSAGASVTIEERDFYNQKAVFTGATGIGRGLRSARPATCTAGVAYWATDGGGNWNTLGEDGGLDLCTATNTWTNDSYVPYTYPHPLVIGGSTLPPDTTPPAAPIGVTVTRAD